jgi:HOOK protein coiled-coil region
VAKYEATIETYKKRLEEMGDLKGQIKYLEEKNNEYIQKNLDLEDELTNLNKKRPQVLCCGNGASDGRTPSYLWMSCCIIFTQPPVEPHYMALPQQKTVSGS